MTVNLRGAVAVTPIVQSVSYDPRGRRQNIAYGNGTSSAYAYDPETFRLTRLTTTRPGDTGALQDLSYTYDPVGNITQPG